MNRPASPVVRRRQLATRLRRLRLQAKLTLEEAAQAIEVSAATLSRIENAQRLPRVRDVRDLVARYGIHDHSVVADLMNLATSAREPGWWEAYPEVDGNYGTYIGLEAAASTIHGCESTMVPALLQTEEYARTLLADAANPTLPNPFSNHDIEKQIEIRLRRQKLLDPGSGLTYSLLLDANVLSRVVGGPKVMQGQIDHLIRIAGQDNVKIQLVPTDKGAHAGQLGSFTILTMPLGVPDIVYVETLGREFFLESPDDVSRHRRAFADMQSKALSEGRSAQLMSQLAL